jgi:hypothetical protein
MYVIVLQYIEDIHWLKPAAGLRPKKNVIFFAFKELTISPDTVILPLKVQS